MPSLRPSSVSCSILQDLVRPGPGPAQCRTRTSSYIDAALASSRTHTALAGYCFVGYQLVTTRTFKRSIAKRQVDCFASGQKICANRLPSSLSPYVCLCSLSHWGKLIERFHAPLLAGGGGTFRCVDDLRNPEPVFQIGSDALAPVGNGIHEL